ncbi:MAG: response regulator [Burkholderiales bacterium]|nr:response regulator [Betaproteobacteria bacterium]
MSEARKRKTILLVEDDADLVELATHWLERDGYAVRSIADGREALEQLAADPLPDLLLLDVMIPHVTGFEVLQKLRAEARTRELPVVMMTSFSRERDVARGRELGANDYIIKPLMELDFLDRVARALGEHRPA